MINIETSNLDTLLNRHDIDYVTRELIENKKLLPITLINKLHSQYPQHSRLVEKSKKIFTAKKNKYTGIKGFREIVEILKENGIILGDLKERELFIEVYRFMVTKHVLNTIDWSDLDNDSVYQLTFPQPNMINERVRNAYMAESDPEKCTQIATDYIFETNPHDGKQTLNRPSFHTENGELDTLQGSQHKYPQVFLLFDKTTQSCFSFCTYCFRHAQVRGDEDMFIQTEIKQVHDYLKIHKEITDILITGGDAGYMPADRMRLYLEPLLTDPELSHIRNVRIASRALTFDPGLVLDEKYNSILNLFRELTDSGIQVLWMGHFSSPKELVNITTIAAIRLLRYYGVNVKSQSPIMNHISLYKKEDGKVDIDKSAQNWIDLANILTMQGVGFHSMYMARPTGEHHYFTVPLTEINQVFNKIYRSLPSVSRPSRYITMTSSAGKISLLGEVDVNGKKAIALKFNEARNMEWLDKTFIAEYDEEQNTIGNLKPFGADKHFFEDELEVIEKELGK
jgi:L-lysine 2,3-aminomutase